MDILERLNNVFKDLFDDESLIITEETTPDDIDGWDSLAQISLVSMLQDEFQIEFEISEIMELTDVSKIITAVSGKTGDGNIINI